MSAAARELLCRIKQPRSDLDAHALFHRQRLDRRGSAYVTHARCGGGASGRDQAVTVIDGKL